MLLLTPHRQTNNVFLHACCLLQTQFATVVLTRSIDIALFGAHGCSAEWCKPLGSEPLGRANVVMSSMMISIFCKIALCLCCLRCLPALCCLCCFFVSRADRH